MRRQPDLPGAVLLAGSLVAIVYPLLEGRQLGWPAWVWLLLSAGQLMTAWDNSPGYTNLVAADNALTHRNGPELARYTALAIAHPQPVDTAGYIATMRVYHAAGIALAHGDTATANTDIATADDMAWDVITSTFAALNRVNISN